MDYTKIDEYFPFNTYREGQKEAIEKILKAFDNGKRVALIEAPTGSGKSVIGLTAAQFFEKSYYITAQRILQYQIIKDFGEGGRSKISCPVIDLQGRNNYQCVYYDAMKEHGGKFAELAMTNPTCDVGECTRQGKSSLDDCKGDLCLCPYLSRKWQATAAKICLLNFSSFFYQWVYGGFQPRDLLIVDEAHNSAQQILSFISLKLSDVSFMKIGIKFPRYETVEEYLIYFDQIGILNIVDNEIEIANREENVKDREEWTRRREKLENLMDMLHSGKDPDARWIVEYSESDKRLIRTLEFKPVFSQDFAERALLGAGKKILLMSATILSPSVICDSLGLRKEDVFSLRMKNRFPVKNRQIIFTPCGSLSFKNKEKSFPDIIKAVNEICKKHVGQKGIIHTHNFEICKRLIDGCDRSTRDRFLFQREWDTKDEMLEHHKTSQDTIILAPAMHEGLDLYDEHARFAVIVKVPYPSRQDKQIMARAAVDPNYYDWLTALKTVQAYGRSVRSETDWAITYILDSDFGWFKKKAGRFLPEWFTEAITCENSYV